MSQRIQIKIAGSGADTDAPTVDDLTDQISDYIDIVKAIEQALAEDTQSAIQWRIVHAVTESPITFTIQAFSRQYAVNVDERARLVVATAAVGFNELARSPQRPTYFTDTVLRKAESIFERVMNGLAETIITTDGDQEPIEITPTLARIGAQNTRAILDPRAKPFKEIGSIEGYFQGVSLDGFGRRILQMRSRVTGGDVKCIVTGDARKQLERCDIGAVWKKKRISVFGTIHFKTAGRISYIEVCNINFFRSASELPDVDAIADPHFTDGLTSEEYLERLRDGGIS